MTALLDACERQNHSLIDAIVSAGADLNQKSPKSGGEADETPLMASAEMCDAWAVQRLLKAGADAMLLTCRQQSAIHYALMFYATNPQPKPEATQIVNALLAAGCPLLGTEIHFATHVRDTAMVRLLLERGSPADVPFPRNEDNGPRKGQSPLDSVVKENSIDLLGGDFGFEPTEQRRGEIRELLLAAIGTA
jgi:ankyrin repeat protein